MSWIDIIAVVPYFITIAVSDGDVSSFGFIRIVRLFRVFRLFLSISKQSTMIKKLITIMKVPIFTKISSKESILFDPVSRR